MKIVPFQYITRKPIPFFQNLRPKKKEKVKTLKTLSGLEIEFRLAIGSSSSSSSSLSSFLSLGLDLAEPRAPFAFESFFLRPWKIGLSSSSSSTSFSSFFTSFESSDGIFFGESKNHNQTILVRDKKIMQIMFRVFEFVKTLLVFEGQLFFFFSFSFLEVSNFECSLFSGFSKSNFRDIFLKKKKLRDTGY